MRTYDDTEYAIILQHLGFTRDLDPKDTLTDPEWICDVEWIHWVKHTPSKTLKVQLISEGAHRVSHSVDGRETNPPTEFYSTFEMIIAIAREYDK